MNLVLAIALGGGIGATLRHYLSSFIMQTTGADFPYGTLTVNVLGCFLMGVVIEAAALRYNLSMPMQAFLTTGLLGGFTTFSAFSLDFMRLTSNGEMIQAFLYAGLSIVLSLAAIFVAMFLARGVFA